MRIETIEYFRCPAEHLWTWIEEPEKQKQWMKGLLNNESTSPGGQKLGSTFRMTIQEGRKANSYDGEVTGHEWPRFLEVCLSGGNFPQGMRMRVGYRLSETAGVTRLDYSCAMEGKKCGLLLRMLFVLAKVFSRMQLRSFLRQLKSLAEASAA